MWRAYGAHPDFIMLAGQRRFLLCWPPLPAHHLLHEAPEPTSPELAHQLGLRFGPRKYAATWAIEADGYLYLSSITGKYSLATEPLRADWFSDEIAITENATLRDDLLFCDTPLWIYTIIKIDRGQVQGEPVQQEAWVDF